MLRGTEPGGVVPVAKPGDGVANNLATGAGAYAPAAAVALGVTAALQFHHNPKAYANHRMVPSDLLHPSQWVGDFLNHNPLLGVLSMPAEFGIHMPSPFGAATNTITSRNTPSHRSIADSVSRYWNDLFGNPNSTGKGGPIQGVVIHNHLYIDGKEIMSVVTKNSKATAART